MKRILSSSLSLVVLSFAISAAAQPPPLPPLPPPATDAAPSSLNPQPAPPAANSEPPPLPPLPSEAPVYAPAAPSGGPPPMTPPPYPYPYPYPPPAGPPPPPPTFVPDGYRLVPIDPTVHLHDGFYFRAGLGGGGMALLGSGPNGPAHVHGPAVSLTVAVGGTVVPGLVIGGAVSVMVTTSQGSSGVNEGISNASFSQLGAFVDWFPDPRGGWHVGSLLGFGSSGLTFSSSQGSNADLSGGSSTTFGGRAFGGYDLWIGDQWSVGLQGYFAFATEGSLKDGDASAGGYSLGGVGGGLELTLLNH